MKPVITEALRTFQGIITSVAAPAQISLARIPRVDDSSAGKAIASC